MIVHIRRSENQRKGPSKMEKSLVGKMEKRMERLRRSAKSIKNTEAAQEVVQGSAAAVAAEVKAEAGAAIEKRRKNAREVEAVAREAVVRVAARRRNTASISIPLNGRRD